jgi:hypothetical protein
MEEVMSACGVLCSGCGAYMAASKGPAYQKEVADAWHRIYGLKEPASNISCSGCLGPDEKVFHTSIRCAARRCCMSKAFRNCAECSDEACGLLARAQSVWDGVPEIGASLSAADFDRYARPYLGHRARLAVARRETGSSAANRFSSSCPGE